MATSHNLTTLLNAWSDGDSAAGSRLVEMLYKDLHLMANQRLRGFSSNITLQATELLHEAFIRLNDQDQVAWANRTHFLAIASTVMRRILLDAARKRTAARRDRRLESPLDEDTPPISAARADELIELDAALEDLAAIAPRQAQVVEMRHFGGLSLDEAAAVLDVSVATIKRDWTIAKAWLYRRLKGADGSGAWP